jgi:hypothetical protein
VDTLDLRGVDEAVPAGQWVASKTMPSKMSLSGSASTCSTSPSRFPSRE